MDNRRIELHMRWREVAQAADLSLAGLGAIRRGDRHPTALTKRKIEDALQWAPDSIDAILAGGEPTSVQRRRRTSDGSIAAAIGAELRKALRHSWLSEAELGTMFDLDKQAIRDRLDGRVPMSRPEVRNICEQLGLNVDDVYAAAEQSLQAANDEAKPELRATP
jgi:DNA-binding XRE family transcriptional regulator